MDIINSQNSNIFRFATEQGRTIVYLHYFDIAICLIIASIVMGLVAYIAIKFRQRPGDAEPKQDTGNLKLELTWTIIPTIIVLVLGVLTAIVMHRINPPVGPSQQADLVVIAHQWWWEYRYPKLGVVASNEFLLPQGVRSLIEFKSADVIHSFWIPNFGQKIDCIPGAVNHLYYTPIQSGLFLGACSEFCGADHSLMRIVAKVVPPKEFDEWVQRQLKVPAASTETQAKHGQELFVSQTCMECHAIAGTAAKAEVGPDLTHLAERQTLGAGVLPNDTKNVTEWIMNPQQFKPGCHMPNMRISKADAHDIAVYLENLK